LGDGGFITSVKTVTPSFFKFSYVLSSLLRFLSFFRDIDQFCVAVFFCRRNPLFSSSVPHTSSIISLERLYGCLAHPSPAPLVFSAPIQPSAPLCLVDLSDTRFGSVASSHFPFFSFCDDPLLDIVISLHHLFLSLTSRRELTDLDFPCCLCCHLAPVLQVLSLPHLNSRLKMWFPFLPVFQTTLLIPNPIVNSKSILPFLLRTSQFGIEGRCLHPLLRGVST